jgi:hypothetical protein
MDYIYGASPSMSIDHSGDLEPETPEKADNPKPARLL